MIPALAAVLDSPDPALAADAATVLGMIGDKEAIPFLTFPAASARSSAGGACRRPRGDCPSDRTALLRPAAHASSGFDRRRLALSSPPCRVSRRSSSPSGHGTMIARRQLRKQVPRTEAEAILGLRLVKQALRLEPRQPRGTGCTNQPGARKGHRAGRFYLVSGQGPSHLRHGEGERAVHPERGAQDRHRRRQDRPGRRGRNCIGAGDRPRRADALRAGLTHWSMRSMPRVAACSSPPPGPW